MRRFRFRLSTLLLFTASISAACAAWVKRDAWYVAMTVPTGYQDDCRLAAFDEQDLLVCLKTTVPERFAVRRLSTGKLLQEMDAGDLRVSYLVAGDNGQLFGHGWHRLVQIDPMTGESEELMRTPSASPESEQIVAVSLDGQFVLIAAHEVVDYPGGGRGKPSAATVTYRVRDVATNELLWELATAETSPRLGTFSTDGRRIALPVGLNVQVWDFGRNERIYDTPFVHSPHTPPVLFSDGRRMFAYFAIWDLQTGDELARLDFGSHYAAIVNDSFLVANHRGNLRHWHRRRQEGSWTPLSFPEPWMAGVFAILCVCDVIRHSRRQAGGDVPMNAERTSTANNTRRNR